MPQIVTGFDRYAQEARALREEKRRTAMDTAAETRAQAQDTRQQTTFDLALKDRETALANDAEDRKYQAQERWGRQFKQDVAVLGSLAQPVPIELVPGMKALIPAGKADGAKYATFSRNAEGLVTGVDYYAEEGDPAPMYQVGLDAEGLAEQAGENFRTFELPPTYDAQGNVSANVGRVNEKTGEIRTSSVKLGKGAAPKAEKEPTPQQEASAASAQDKLRNTQALQQTKSAVAPVRAWMVEAGYGGFKDPYEAKANLELLLQTEEQAPEPNTRKITAMKRALGSLDRIVSSLDSGAPVAPGAGSQGGGTFDPGALYGGTGLN